jgi:hypothetical protein
VALYAGTGFALLAAGVSSLRLFDRARVTAGRPMRKTETTIDDQGLCAPKRECRAGIQVVARTFIAVPATRNANVRVRYGFQPVPRDGTRM